MSPDLRGNRSASRAVRLRRAPADAAVAEHRGGDAVPARRRELRIPGRLAVVVGGARRRSRASPARPRASISLAGGPRRSTSVRCVRRRSRRPPRVRVARAIDDRAARITRSWYGRLTPVRGPMSSRGGRLRLRGGTVERQYGRHGQAGLDAPSSFRIDRAIRVADSAVKTGNRGDPRRTKDFANHRFAGAALRPSVKGPLLLCVPCCSRPPPRAGRCRRLRRQERRLLRPAAAPPTSRSMGPCRSSQCDLHVPQRTMCLTAAPTPTAITAALKFLN